MSDDLGTLASPGPSPGWPRLERLLVAMEGMPVQPTAALRVMWECDDPRSSGASVGRALGEDPVLAARVLRVANSAMYGQRSAVSSLPRAVSVLGFSTVKALAVMSTWGSFAPGLGTGFWLHSALVAHASRELALRAGAPPDDAFALGLLHELGLPLLREFGPSRWVPPADEAEELAFYGISHGEAAARVLVSWQLPLPLVRGVASHAAPYDPDAPPLERVVKAAEGLAEMVGMGMAGCHPVGAPDAMAAIGLDEAEANAMSEALVTVADDLAAALGTGAASGAARASRR
jgi:HD-like signal output (HDOD) protein